MNQLDMHGKRVVVTGGAAGLGLAIARRVAASGARPVLWDRDASALQAAARELAGASGVQVDVADAASVRAAMAATQDGGAVDALINCAGITGPNAPVMDYPEAAWRQVLDVNLTGTFLCCQAVLPQMRERGSGRIVNIASVAGKEGNPNAAAYSASKAGVIALTKSLGKELAGTDIRVNCVTPAAVKTAIFDQMTPQHIDYMLSRIPMGRFGLPEEVAAMVAWLCTEDCSFSTGAVFDLSGGRSTY
ncbi:SDR family NAD(P)-dependent oxidoreductase [Bordetella genomosp. 13]|uniref:SDR family NAD(P)-dependent oxidoreductase n=1 Tax=Bordetella genomosp. 13 TaxID=463040 RepID=UPI00119E7941|nr:SDR family NAD(P)-dependent oxidoreductase [Bordetella genomosp. 13]